MGASPHTPYWDWIKRTAREEAPYGRHRMRRHLFWDKMAFGGVDGKSEGRAWAWSEPAPY